MDVVPPKELELKLLGQMDDLAIDDDLQAHTKQYII